MMVEATPIIHRHSSNCAGGSEYGDARLWLPIDAKFPHEDYEKPVDASERGDVNRPRKAVTEGSWVRRRAGPMVEGWNSHGQPLGQANYVPRAGSRSGPILFSSRLSKCCNQARKLIFRRQNLLHAY
jgi:hypothetical protein